jgi:RNA polymerase sigma-70 factor (ECF subfamily)
MAFLVLLEQLSPAERAVFLLREVFEYDYGEIATIIHSSEANCRQMLHRARQRLEGGRPRFDVSPEQQQELTSRFAQACLTGDLEGLVGVLAEEVTLWSDGGGRVAAAQRPVQGADRVGRFLLGLMGRRPANFASRFAVVNGQPAFISFIGGRPFGAMVLEMAGGRIRHIRLVVNPDKLGHIQAIGAAEGETR